MSKIVNGASESLEPTPSEVRFEYTAQFPAILEHLKASVLVTTYQAGKLFVLGVHAGRLQISALDYDQPMGLATSRNRIAIGTRRQMHFLVPAHETQSNQTVYDGCFVPRSTIYTGSIHGHELAWGDEGLWVVNTLFSCLSTLHEDYSFVPQWRPPFISQLIDQDRCHLNGLALQNNVPRYVSALSETDTPAGWRPDKATSGVVMQIPSGEVICRNLSMPHSPRLHDGKLWILDSGRGALSVIDDLSGRAEVVESMPGFTRGLSFAGQFAFVGLSRIRETSVFGGLPISETREQLRCGVGIVDLLTGKTVAVFQFQSGVTEVFAVEVLAGFANPLVAGASVDQQEKEVWIVPDPNGHRPKSHPRVPVFSNSKVSAGVGSSDESISFVRACEFEVAGRKLEASAMFEKAIAISSTPEVLLIELGNWRQDQGNQLAAKLCYERALEYDPNNTVALQNLGYLLFNLGDAEQAQEVYARLLSIQPSTLNRLLAASVFPVVYDSEVEIEYWRERQIAILKQAVAANSPVDATKTLVPTCFFAAYQGRCDRELMELRGGCISGKDFTGGRVAAHETGKKLRVGFLSAYFREHTIGHLNIGRLKHLSRDQIHLTVIYANRVHDGLTEQFRSIADEFVQLPRELPHAIEVLSKTNLDILVHADVGMDSLTQTLAYSRFAPVQLATWGHPDTSGSPVIDYFLSSEGLEVSGSQKHYTEKLLKLPTLGLCYERPKWTAAETSRGERGLPEDKHLYACPQTLFKFHPDFDRILARILEIDPLGELILIEGRLPEWNHRLKRRFRRTLPNSSHRIRFVASKSRSEFLQLLADVDVVLDPIHFGGGNSSIEAIAVGTPIVTLEGRFARDRITSCLLSEIGCFDLIAKDSAEYCGKACAIASDPLYRSELQGQLLWRSEGWFGNPHPSEQLENCLQSLV